MPRIGPRRSIAHHLLVLTTGLALLSELLTVVPWVVRQRDDWLTSRVTQGFLAALVATDGDLDPRARADLLRIADVGWVRVVEIGRPILDMPQAKAPPAASMVLDLRTETTLQRLQHTLATLVQGSDRKLLVVGAPAGTPTALVRVIVREDSLAQALRSYAIRVGLRSLALIAAIWTLVYLSLLRLVVWPMRRLTQSIAAFRADPEHTALPGPTENGLNRRDEVGDAARELAALQREMRTTLWRNARLAALGAAVAKVSHDLRGTLAPALLAAERLETDPDPAVQQTGAVLMRAIDRTTEIFTRTLEFSRDTPFAPVRTRFPIQPLIEEAAELAGAVGLGLTVTLAGAITSEIDADRMQLLRVFSNLLRNAGEAKAENVTVDVTRRPGGTVFIVSDDGPGLPASVQRELFRPFVRGSRPGSTGLGLAIIRDLVLAHGGSIALERTGPSGTRFRIALPDVLPAVAGTLPPFRRTPPWRQVERPDPVKESIKRAV